MSYRDTLYKEWRKAEGKVKAGKKLGWPSDTMEQLRNEALAAFQAVHNEELRLANDPTAKLRG